MESLKQLKSKNRAKLTFTRRGDVCSSAICENFTIFHDTNTKFICTSFKSNCYNHDIMSEKVFISRFTACLLQIEIKQNKIDLTGRRSLKCQCQSCHQLTWHWHITRAASKKKNYVCFTSIFNQNMIFFWQLIVLSCCSCC